MAKHATEQQNQDIKSSNFISLCLDESTDVTSSARLAVFIRYLVGNNIKEELISLTSLATTTRGVDINEIVIKALSEKEIDLSKVVSVTTDGAPSMIGKENGFVNLFQRQVGHSLLGFHCIIHQQALCAKAGFKSLENIMSLVTKIVNLISSQALNKRKFEVLLSEIDSVYHGLLMYNNVRWLSRGKVLQRFVDCLEEIRLFLHNEGKGEQYKQLMDVEWISTLMFVTDLCQHLNVKLQGANKTVIIMIDMIKSFEAKLKIFYKDIISSNFKYFPNLKKIVTDLESHEEQDKAKLIQEFSTVISSLMAEFSSRFTEFKEYSDTLKFVLYPDTTEFDKLNLDVFRWLNLEEIELQITEFQSSSIWKQKFIDLRNDLEIIERDRLSDIINRNAEIQILTTWNAIPNTFSCLKMLACAVLTIFSSTYACESLFSEMNFIKNSLGVLFLMSQVQQAFC